MESLFALDNQLAPFHNMNIMNAQMKQNRFFMTAMTFFAVIFFLQVFSFIISNEMNGIHFGKRRARLSSPVKQSVALQLKYDSLEDISVETQSGNAENPILKVNGFSGFRVVENNAGYFHRSKEETGSSSAPPLFTLCRIFRI